MRYAMLALLTTAILTATPGCATTSDPGWQGQNATPMGTADVLCRSEADENPGAGEMTYNACMARHGWTRGGGD